MALICLINPILMFCGCLGLLQQVHTRHSRQLTIFTTCYDVIRRIKIISISKAWSPLVLAIAEHVCGHAPMAIFMLLTYRLQIFSVKDQYL